MRKRNKIKKRSCALCKPHKTGHCCRWKEKDSVKLKEFEKNRAKFIRENLLSLKEAQEGKTTQITSAKEYFERLGI